MSNCATTNNPGKTRLPIVKTAADIEGLTHLSKEEKEMGVKNIKRIPVSDGWQIMGNDPELQIFLHMMERQFTALLEGDFQGIPFSPMCLMCAETGRQTNSSYVYDFFVALIAREMPVFDVPWKDTAKLALLDNPDSDLWSEEERLVLKFTKAVHKNEMTDELFEQARLAWGEKRILRSIAWISFVDMWGKLSNTLGLEFRKDMIAEDFAIPRAAINGVMPFMQKFRGQIKDFVENTMDLFPGH